MIGAILGVANGLLPVKPLDIVNGVLNGLKGDDATRSRAVDTPALRLSQGAQRAGFAPAQGQIDVGAYRAQYEANLSAFQNELGKLFSESGLDVTQDVTLKLDPAKNRLVVDGDHPQSSQIEAFLDQFPRLTASFKRLEAQSQFLNAQAPAGEDTSIRQALQAYRESAGSSAYTVTISKPGS